MPITDVGAAILRGLDPETAHGLAIAALKTVPQPGAPADDPILRTQVAGLDLPNPVGLAAGLDKNGEALHGLARLGFGFVECGSVTPLPQAGNPKPRLFRLTRDKAIINRMGFNNAGLEAFADNLSRGPNAVVGANLGANKETEDKAADYVAGLRRLAGLSDYFTINISSPNTPGLRDLQHGAALDELLAACTEARGSTPLFLKVAPDLDAAAIDGIVRAAIDRRIDAIIMGNTTVSRPPLRSPHAGETGGLSGAPLATLARQRLADVRAASGGGIALIAAGGVDSGAEAYARIRAGASFVQLYSALVFEGPGLARRILTDLDACLAHDGFASVTDAVGA